MKFAVLTCTGVSSALAALGTSVGGTSLAYPLWVPDPESYPPFQVSVQVTATTTSTGATTPAYNIEWSNDFVQQSIFGTGSTLVGFLGVSSTSVNAPTWNTFSSSPAQSAATFGSTTLTGATTAATGAIFIPVSAIRLNVTNGTSVQTITAKLVQAG